LRRAGASARVMMVAAAAQRWNVDPSSCKAENGAVVHAATGRKLTYGALAEAAAKLPVPPDVVLKKPGQVKPLGQSPRRLSTGDNVCDMRRASEKRGAVARHEGDAASAIASAARKFDAVYEQPFLAHATMEPMNCTVHLTKDGCDIWVGTQIPGITQMVAMKITGMSKEQVRIHNHLLGGGF